MMNTMDITTTITTSTAEASQEELNRRVLAMADQMLDLLRRFGREQISAEELVAALPEFAARATLAQHWERLTADPALGPCFEVLHLLSSLESEADYQMLRYGPPSLHEDFRELNLAVTRLRKTMQPGA